MLVVGEAGIGKTRLVAEAATNARTAGMRVLWASAWEPGGAPAHWHWIQILRSLASAQDPQSLVRHLGSDAHELSRLVPDIRPGVQLAAPGEPEGDDARFRMYDAAAAFLRRASERAPLLLVLDDLHASDAGTIALLRFVIADIADGRLAIIGTTRDPQTDRVGVDVATALVELGREAGTLQLARSGSP